MAKKQTGAVLYQGPSMLDGNPIVVIMTGINRSSKNRKTGRMLQTWILRADISPREATLTHGDVSICGDCPQRRNIGGACYVVIEQAPLAVWRAWKRGRYADWTARFPDNALAGKRVRMGSYGDPAAVPQNIWRRVHAQKLASWTGYTHQWKKPQFSWLSSTVMASVDNEAEAVGARDEGWRYFRVTLDGNKLQGEAICPASDEAGKRSSCEKCTLCQGVRREARDIVIRAHGYLKKRLPIV